MQIRFHYLKSVQLEQAWNLWSLFVKWEFSTDSGEHMQGAPERAAQLEVFCPP